VLLKGRHGVGKTTVLLDAFNKKGLRYKYFSCATLDAWVDFVGLPKEAVDANGTKYLELIPPKEFAYDAVDIIFLDEFNRAPKRVRNACMELIQFKSINGRKFNNLKMVWAAVNPDNDDDMSYDVEKIDPAQLDRFEIHCDVPYRPVAVYFRDVFGKAIADNAVSWWNELDEKSKHLVSPRRLDYALKVWQAGGALRMTLPESVNVKKLQECLSNGSVKTKLKQMLKSGNTTEATEFLSKHSNFDASRRYIYQEKGYSKFFMPLLDAESLASFVSNTEEEFKDTAVSLMDSVFNDYSTYESQVKEWANSPDAGPLSKRAREVVTKQALASQQFTINTDSIHKTDVSEDVFLQGLKAFDGKELNNTHARVSVYTYFADNIPSTFSSYAYAEKVFDVLTVVLKSSSINTIKDKMPKLAGMLQHTTSELDRISKIVNVSWAQNKVDSLEKLLDFGTIIAK
jgi:hypothetical protein